MQGTRNLILLLLQLLRDPRGPSMSETKLHKQRQLDIAIQLI